MCQWSKTVRNQRKTADVVIYKLQCSRPVTFLQFSERSHSKCAKISELSALVISKQRTLVSLQPTRVACACGYSQHVGLVHVVTANTCGLCMWLQPTRVACACGYSQHVWLVHVVTANTWGFCMCFTRWGNFYRAYVSRRHSLVGILTVGQQDITYTILDIPYYYRSKRGRRMFEAKYVQSTTRRQHRMPPPPINGMLTFDVIMHRLAKLHVDQTANANQNGGMTPSKWRQLKTTAITQP